MFKNLYQFFLGDFLDSKSPNTPRPKYVDLSRPKSKIYRYFFCQQNILGTLQQFGTWILDIVQFKNVYEFLAQEVLILRLRVISLDQNICNTFVKKSETLSSKSIVALFILLRIILSSILHIYTLSTVNELLLFIIWCIYI